MLKKIVVTGPESTGKSTLCEKLADHYHTYWCPEFAREYLTRHGTKYSFEDLLKIAEGQIAGEEKYTGLLEKLPEPVRTDPPSPGKDPSLLFIDTDMYVMKIWCEFVFGKVHPYILQQIASHHYDLYLLCNIDQEWIPDELREYPDIETRRELYHIYRQTLKRQTTPWVEISGSYTERLSKAVESIDRLLLR